MDKKYKIVNIHRNFKRNNGRFIYAQLRDADTDELIISSDLDYILESININSYILVGDII